MVTSMKMLKKLNTIVYSMVLSVTSLWSIPLFADDTDIYVNSAQAGEEPMIMFILDWRSNLVSNLGTSVVSNACSTQLQTASAPPTATSSGIITNIATACGWSEAYVTSLVATVDVTDGTLSRLDMLRGILNQTMASLGGVKIGLMLNHDNNCTGNPKGGPTKTDCSNGAYIVSGFKSITSSPTDTNKVAFQSLLAGIPPLSGSGHVFQGKEVYFELFRYLTGQGIYNGHVGWKDFGNTTDTDNLDGTGGPESPDYSALAWDTSIEHSGNYISPFIDGTQCAKVYALNFIFGVINNQDESDSAIGETYANGGMNGLTLSGGANTQFGTTIQWMYNTDLADGNITMQYLAEDDSTTPSTWSIDNAALDLEGSQYVTSYFIVQSPSTTENGWAQNGGTNSAVAWSDDPDEMVAKLRSVFNQILSVSTTFVSASVPVNVFNRAEFLDDVYIAVFEAEENGFPQWIGNLKKLKLTQDASYNWFIGDANQNPAFSADGRINFDALTFWTTATGEDVVAADTAEGEISGYDGRSVNRGGAGQKIPGMLVIGGTTQNGTPGTSNGSGYRKVFTEPASYTNGLPSDALMALNATTANADALWSDLNADGIASSASTTNTPILNNTAWSSYATYADADAASSPDVTEALDLLKFARGIDTANPNDPRPWIMADPIHSRPLTINYGDSDGVGGYSATNPDVRIIVTSNSGAVHMIENTTSAGAESGAESWAFYPRYALRIQKRLKDNAAGSPSMTSEPVHPYGVDGAPAVYTYDANYDGNLVGADGDKVYLYFGMRRGGRSYYALDISYPNNPKMLWSISSSDAAFSEMGLTFSRPQLTKLSYNDGTSDLYNEPVLIFGGGYDVNKDIRSDNKGTNDSMGRAIYIVNAKSGALVWKAVYGSSTTSSATTDTYPALTDSIPSDAALLDSDGDGSTDRIYIGSTGGDIFRINMPGLDRTAWSMYHLAKLGRAVSGSQKADDRRFFHSIDVVQSLDAYGYFDAVIVGSGDRANPLDKNISSNKVPVNWFYMIKDRGVAKDSAPKFLPYPGPPSVDTVEPGDLADLSDNCMQYDSCDTTNQLNKLRDYGWRIKLEQDTGEKALSKPITLGGTIFFTTYIPPDTTLTATCGPIEGGGSTYAVNLQDATPAFDWDLTNSFVDGNGVTQVMGVTDRYRQAGAGIPADVIAIRKGGLLQAVTPGDNYTTTISGNAGWKTFWYTEGD